MAAELPGVAGQLNIVIEQGARFSMTVAIPVATHPLTGYASARMQGRRSKASSVTLFSWSTSGGEITLDTVDNEVVVSVAATATDDLNFGSGVWDLELVPTSGEADAQRWLEGVVTLSKEVTR